MRRVILVAGAPCAGKSTHVARHAKPGDLVLDQDVIGAAAMRAGLARVAAMTTGTAWVIRCAPGPRRRQRLAAQIRATDVVLLHPGDDELHARATRRPHPRRAIQAVRDWIRREAADEPPGRTTRRGAARPPRPARSTSERGYGHSHQQARAAALAHLARHPGQPCARCGQPMYVAQALDLDHTDDRRAYRGLAHRSCNRRAGQAVAQTRRRTRVTSTNTQRVVNSRRW